MISINKLKGINEVKMTVMNFTLKFITLTKPETSFNG
jgi:hypothetical protein